MAKPRGQSTRRKKPSVSQTTREGDDDDADEAVGMAPTTGGEAPPQKNQPETKTAASASTAAAGGDDDDDDEETKKRKPAAKKAKKEKAEPTAIARSATPRHTPIAKGDTLFKILSVNVAGLRATLDPAKGKVAAFESIVRAEDPDVLLLNEHKLNPGDVEAAEARLEELFPDLRHRVFACSTAKKGYSGVAAFSKTPLVDVTLDFPGNAFPDEGRVVAFDVLDRRAKVIAVYVPNSGQNLDRLPARVEGDRAWDRALSAFVKSSQSQDEKKPVLVIGDMNVAHRARDIHNMYARPTFESMLQDDESDAAVLEEQYKGIKAAKTQAGLTPAERLSFSRLLDDASLRDAFRVFHPSALGVFTYYSQRVVQNRPLNRGLRLDYVLASDTLFAAPECNETTTTTTTIKTADDPPPPLRILDAFVLDKDPAIADHVPVGCLLGPAR